MSRLYNILDKMLAKYEDYYTVSMSITAGSVGSYATHSDINVAKTGYTPVAVSFRNIGHGGSYHPIVFLINEQTARVQLYRVGTGAYSVPAYDMCVRVFYRKS